MTADARCRRGAASVTAVAGEDEELCGGEGEYFAFRGCAGGFVYLLGCLLPHHLFQFMPPWQQSWGGTSAHCGRKMTYSSVSLATWSRSRRCSLPDVSGGPFSSGRGSRTWALWKRANDTSTGGRSCWRLRDCLHDPIWGVVCAMGRDAA